MTAVSGHPGARPTSGDDVPVVALAPAAWARWASVAVAWIGALGLATVFLALGTMIDVLAAGRAIGGPAVVAVVIGGLVAACAAAASAAFAERSSAVAERDLRARLVERVFTLGVRGTAGREGELLATATEMTERVAHYRAAFLGPIIGSLTTPLLMLAVMAVAVDAVSAGILALLLLLIPLLIGGFRRIVRPVGAQLRAEKSALTAAFLHAVQALETLVYARAADRTAARLAARGEAHRGVLMRVLAANQLLILVVDAAFSLAIIVAAVLLGATRAGAGEISLGDALAIVLLAVLVIGPVDVMGQFFYIGIGGRAAQRHLRRTLAPLPDRPNAGASVEAGAAGAIELRGVSVGWDPDRPVVTDLDLTVRPGERVALVGPSGAGKSTVAALLQGHLVPSAGTASVDGLSLIGTDPELIRSRLSVVAQRTFLFLGTIAENLRLAAPDADDARLWQALEAAGLRTDVERMPERLETPVGEHGTRLSGGQAQRLGIARAWLRDAPVLLLDEPTSQVDLAGEATILAALDRLAAGRTVLMIAHRPEAILATDRVVRLGEGGRA